MSTETPSCMLVLLATLRLGFVEFSKCIRKGNIGLLKVLKQGKMSKHNYTSVH